MRVVGPVRVVVGVALAAAGVVAAPQVQAGAPHSAAAVVVAAPAAPGPRPVVSARPVVAAASAPGVVTLTRPLRKPPAAVWLVKVGSVSKTTITVGKGPQRPKAPAASTTGSKASAKAKVQAMMRKARKAGTLRRVRLTAPQVTVSGLPVGSIWQVRPTLFARPSATVRVLEYVGDPADVTGRLLPEVGGVSLGWSHERSLLNDYLKVGYRVIASPLDGEGATAATLVAPATAGTQASTALKGLDEAESGYVFTVQATNPVSVSKRSFRTVQSLGKTRVDGGDLTLVPYDPATDGVPAPPPTVPVPPVGGSVPGAGGGSSGGGTATPPLPPGVIAVADWSGPVFDEVAGTVTFSSSGFAPYLAGYMDAAPGTRDISWTGVDSTGTVGVLTVTLDPALRAAVVAARAEIVAAEAALTAADAAVDAAQLVLVAAQAAYAVDPSPANLAARDAAQVAADAAVTATVAAEARIRAAVVARDAAMAVADAATTVTMTFAYSGGFGGAAGLSWSITEHFFDAAGRSTTGASSSMSVPVPPAAGALLAMRAQARQYECSLANANNPARPAGITVAGRLSGTRCVTDANVTNATGYGAVGGGAGNGFVVLSEATSAYTFHNETRTRPVWVDPAPIWTPTGGGQHANLPCAPGESQSWAQWPNGGAGGSVCNIPGWEDPPGYWGSETYTEQVKDAPPAGYVDNGTAYVTVRYGVNTDPASIPVGYSINPVLLNADGTPIAQGPNDTSWAAGAYVRAADEFTTYKIALPASADSVSELTALGVSEVWVSGVRWDIAGGQTSTADLGRCPALPSDPGLPVAVRGLSGTSAASLRACN